MTRKIGKSPALGAPYTPAAEQMGGDIYNHFAEQHLLGQAAVEEEAHLLAQLDPRLTVPLARPVVALDKIIRVSFVHEDDRQPTFAVQQEIPWLKASRMRKGVKPGKIRLQVNGPGEHREMIFDDAVELLVFVEMADRFLQALVK